MSSKEGIYVNRIDVDIDRKEFDKHFVTIYVKYGGEEGYKIRSDAVKIISGYGEVIRAVKYGSSGELYVLCDRESDADEIIDKLNKMTLDQVMGDESKPAVRKYGSNLYDDVILELLNISLNSIKYDESEDISYSNLDGAMYSFGPSDYSEDRITTLNIKYDRAWQCNELFGNTMMKFGAQSFTNINLKKRMKFSPGKPFENYVQYIPYDKSYMQIYRPNQLLRKGQGRYIKHGCRGIKKATIPFFEYGDIDKLNNSKMGRIAKSMRRLRKEYPTVILKLDFHRTTMFDDTKFAKKSGIDKKFDEILKTLCVGKKFYIVNSDDDPLSGKFIENIKIDMKNLFDIDIIDASEPVRGGLNFEFVHKKRGDEHYCSYTDVPVQHVAFESLEKYYVISKYEPELIDNSRTYYDEAGNEIVKKVNSGIRSQFSVMLIDLFIKSDIQKNEQSFFSYMSEKLLKNGGDRDLYYISRPRLKNPVEGTGMSATYGNMVVMKLSSDGFSEYNAYSHSEAQADPLLSLCWKQYDDKFSNNGIMGIVSDLENTYVFRKTDVRMIPDVEDMIEKLKSIPPKYSEKKGKYVPSTDGIRKERELYLKACTDIRCGYDDEGHCYYFVGTCGDGMDTTITWSVNLNKIQLLTGTEPLPDCIFEMMLAPFVRFKGMTVTPYPFKYVHEYERMFFKDVFEPEPDDNDDENGDEDLDTKQMTLDNFF